MGDVHGFRDKLDPGHRWTALGCALLHHQPVRDPRNCPHGRLGARTLAGGTVLHWVLDDTFQEDRCRLRMGHTACNMAALRRIALNFLTLMQQYFRPRMSIRRLRKMVARNPARLEPVMAL